MADLLKIATTYNDSRPIRLCLMATNRPDAAALDGTYLFVYSLNLAGGVIFPWNNAATPITQLDVYYSPAHSNNLPQQLMPFPNDRLLPEAWRPLVCCDWAYCLPGTRTSLGLADLDQAFRFTWDNVADAFLCNNACKIPAVAFWVPTIPPGLYMKFLAQRTQGFLDKVAVRVQNAYRDGTLQTKLIPPAAPYPAHETLDMGAWIQRAPTREARWLRAAHVALVVYRRCIAKRQTKTVAL